MLLLVHLCLSLGALLFNPKVAKINTQIGVLERHLQSNQTLLSHEERVRGLVKLGNLMYERNYELSLKPLDQGQK
jgi:hypothetical protein|tara:strand:+ start:556 stop:780 length:225 start_codon:yes stop_codon:yes gene_type:complete